MPKGFKVHPSPFTVGDTGYSRVGTPRQPVVEYARPYRITNEDVKVYEPTDEVKLAAMVATAAPRIPWIEFISEHFQWERGEHVGLIGPTGQGKTTLIFNLYPMHPFSIAFGTKPRDENMDAFVNSGFARLEHWESLPALNVPRRVIWPQPQKLSLLVPHQRQVFTDAFEAVYSEGYWDLIIDEGYYLDEVLKLGAFLRLFYTQARSMMISLLMATQRPAWVPVEVYDQSTHLFFWRDNDARNLARLREVSVIHSEAIREIVPNLERHQVLYLNTRTGFMCRTRCPKIDMPLGR
jgi:hypothetical protein